MVKSHTFIGKCFTVWLLLFSAACSANNSTTITNFQSSDVSNQNANLPEMVNVDKSTRNQNGRIDNENSITKVVKNENSKTLDCNNPNEYGFVVVENPNRKNYGEPLIPKDLNIVVGDEVLAKIELPIPDSEAKNFALNSVEKTKVGFEIKIEWGGGLYHYEIQFNFRCKENNLYLYKVKNENFSTKNPESNNLWDIKKVKETKIEPNLPIEKFAMIDYLD